MSLYMGRRTLDGAWWEIALAEARGQLRHLTIRRVNEAALDCGSEFQCITIQ